MRNLFTGVQVQFPEHTFDNRHYNQSFDRAGFRQHMLPEQETSIERVEREMSGWLTCYGFNIEHELTSVTDKTVTLYLSGGRVPAAFQDWLLTSDLFTSVIYGSVKQDGTFCASKAKSNKTKVPQQADALVEEHDLKQSQLDVDAGRDLVKTCEQGDIVTFVTGDDQVCQGEYQGPSAFDLGIEVLQANGHIRVVYFQTIRAVASQTPEQEINEAGDNPMLNTQTLVTKYETYRNASRTSTEQYIYTEVLLSLTREDPVADLEKRLSGLDAQSESTSVLVKREIFEEALASVKNIPMPTTIEQADALVEQAGMTHLVEEYEHNEHGHVYTLVNGGSLVVTSPVNYYLVLDDDQLATMPITSSF